MATPASWSAVLVVFVVTLAFAGARSGAASQAPETAPALVWEATGFTAPESVVFDAGRRQFYVSNMGTWGQGSTPDDGFISRLGADGRVLDLRWVTGFDSPKGLALANGRLYVADDADLVEIDPGAGVIVARHKPADGPGGFNDCTADARGTVYVFSRRRSTVFRLRAGRFEPWAKVDASKTGWPNGLLAERDRLLLGSWVARGADGDERFGILSAVAYADGAVSQLGTPAHRQHRRHRAGRPRRLHGDRLGHRRRAARLRRRRPDTAPDAAPGRGRSPVRRRPAAARRPAGARPRGQGLPLERRDALAVLPRREREAHDVVPLGALESDRAAGHEQLRDVQEQGEVLVRRADPARRRGAGSPPRCSQARRGGRRSRPEPSAA